MQIHQHTLFQYQILVHQQFQDGDWHCEAIMGIEEVRILHHTITEYLDKFDDIPPVNKSYLEHIQSKMFGMIAEYNLEL